MAAKNEKSEKKKKRDGFVVREQGTDKEVSFIECTYNGNMRDRVESGLVNHTDLDRFYVEDTRDSENS